MQFERRLTKSDLTVNNTHLAMRHLSELACREYIEHDDIRIYPAVILMENAFEMKQFYEKFSIKNYGSRLARVKILPPNSSNFKFETIPNGVILSPGMEIVRRIRHTYRAQTSLSRVNFPIIVNDYVINYEIIITVPQANIIPNESELDFGFVDVGTSAKRVITLQNQGRSQTYFSMDLVPEPHFVVIVTPKKGVIDALESVKITVEISGDEASNIFTEFWIKTKPDIRIQITAKIITPDIMCLHPSTQYDIEIIDFPTTYYGSRCIKTLIIQNISSKPTMFCSLIDTGAELVDFKEATKFDNNFLFFEIKANDGRLQPFGQCIMQIIFAPFKTMRLKKKYAYGFLRLTKVEFRDTTMEDLDSFKLEEVKSGHNLVKSSSSEVIQQTNDDQMESTVPKILPAPYIRVCFHGEIEEVSFKVRPETVRVDGVIGQTYEHELNLKNHSKNLPIWYRVAKMPYVTVIPNSGKLEVNQAIEILLSIKPQTMAQETIKLKFELFYPRQPHEDVMDVIGQDCVIVYISGTMEVHHKSNKYVTGITPFVGNEVGFVEDPVTFAMRKDLPKLAIVSKEVKVHERVLSSDLIGLPNDRPRSLRPWREETKCLTLFTNLPRIVTSRDSYNLTQTELDFRKQNDVYYVKFFREYAKTHSRLNEGIIRNKKPSDYEITKKERILMEKEACYSDFKKQKTHFAPSFFYSIPLAPIYLHNINIYPREIHLGQITPNSTRYGSFHIENNNSFPISVTLRTTKKILLLPIKQLMVQGNTSVKCEFVLTVSVVNNITACIAVLLNSCHICNIVIFGKAVAPSLKCDVTEIVMDSSDTRYFISFQNQIDLPTSFSWQVMYSDNFLIYPRQGIVPGQKEMTCVLIFLNTINCQDEAELIMSSNGHDHTIGVKHSPRTVDVEFHTEELDCGIIPCNVLTISLLNIKNKTNNTISFAIENPVPLFGLQIKPTEGLMKPNSTRVYQVSCKFRKPMEFRKTVTFVFENMHKYSVVVKGTVVFPQLKITPPKIHIAKIVPQAMVRNVFTIENTSEVNSDVKFMMDEIKEFTIRDDADNIIKDLTILPGESTDFLLEFAPTEALAYSVYLPLQMNKIYGPPGNSPSTHLSAAYLSDTCAIKDDEDIVMKPLPKFLPTLYISCAAGPMLIKFSKLSLTFNKNNNEITETFSMKNVSDNKVRLILDLTELSSSFELDYVSGPIIRDYDKTVFIRFAPEDEAIYEITFVETKYGEYKNKLPVYIKEYFDNCVFNFLTLQGVYSPPIMKFEKRHIFFEAVKPLESAEEKLEMEMLYHQSGCCVLASSGNNFITTTIEESPDNKNNRTITMNFSPAKVFLLDEEIIFNCSCGAEAKIRVLGAADDCVATSYMSYLTKVPDNSSIVSELTDYSAKIYENVKFSLHEDDFARYPYFPTSEIGCPLYHTKYKALSTVEHWLYEQGFFFKEYYKLPYVIRNFNRFQVEDKRKKKDSRKLELLPIQELLRNICGRAFSKYLEIDIELYRDDPIQETIYCYSFYKNLLKVLRKLGMMAPHIFPELLITYQQYEIFRDKLEDKKHNEVHDMIEDETFFNAFATQSWLDLILQIFKLFVLSNVSKDLPDMGEEFINYFETNKELVNGNCRDEVILLLWLEYNYNTYHSKFFKSFKKRNVRNFAKDLNDGLVFAVLICVFCPYVIEDVSSIITENIESEETMVHNACTLLKALKKVGLMIFVDPIDMVFTNALTMIFLTTYLYSTLPSLLPSITITLKSQLGQSSNEELVVRNPSTFTICYTVILIPENEMFKIEPQTLVIPPEGSKSITITYKARKIFKTTTTLILSGESTKYKCGKSIAYTLEGVPSYAFKKEFQKTIKIYVPTRMSLSIVSPFKDYTSDIYIKVGSKKIDSECFVSWEEWQNLKIPRQLYSEQNQITFDENGIGDLELSVCYLSPGKKNISIFFLHDLGDFCFFLRLNVKAKHPMTETIILNVPFVMTKSTCVCPKGSIKDRCPRAIKVRIPSQSIPLWDGLLVLLQNSRPAEAAFWEKYIYYPIGIKILKMMMTTSGLWEFEEFDKLFGENVEYKIKPTKKLHAQPKVVISDVTEKDEETIVFVHWSQNKPPKSEYIRLISTVGTEIRHYRLLFIDNKKRISDVKLSTDNMF